MEIIDRLKYPPSDYINIKILNAIGEHHKSLTYFLTKYGNGEIYQIVDFTNHKISEYSFP